MELPNFGNFLVIMIIDSTTGQTDSFGNLLKKCIRTSLLLRKKGIQKGEVIAIFSGKHLNFCVPTIACFFIGSSPCMLNPTLSATEIELILVHLKPKLIFADQNLVNVIKNLVEKLHIEILIVEETISYSKNGFSTEYLAEENEFEPIYIDNLEETCTILPITGSNNLLRRNHYHYFHVVSTAITEALHTQNKENIANELHFLNYDTYFSASGLDIFLSIIHGSTNVLCNSRPETFWDLVEKYKISVVFLETSHVEQLMKYKKRGKTDTSSLGRLVVTGSLIPNQYLTALQELIPEAQISALLTNMETGPIITFTKQNLRDAGYVGENLEVVGVPICGIRYKIVNPDSGETLGQYKEGELRVKNKAITEGHDGVYSDKFDDNGWFKTGYKMAYNENCFFFRTKEELSNGLTSTESTVQNSMAEDDPYIVDENHIITIKSRFTPKEGGLGHQIFHSMKNYSDRVAQYLADTEEEDTYQGLLSRCIRLSLNLQSYNLEKDDVIMLCTNNHKNSCVPFLASLFVGVQVASLDPSLSVIETTYLLKEVQPRIIFLSEDSVDLIEESLANAGITPEIIFFGNGTKYRSFEDLLVPHEDEETFSPIFVENLEEPALIVFSSGATGFPKGIVINHYAISCQIGNALDPRQRHCILVYNTLYWISAILICTASILSGGSRVVSHSFDPKEVWHLIDKYRVNGLFLATPAIKSMLTAGRPEDVETSSLSILYCPGVPLPESYIKQLKTVLPKTFVLQSYGQSEVAGSLTQFIGYNKEKTSVVLSKPNSVGLPREGMSYRVVNLETGANCGPNESGELRIKSKIMMNGYYKRDCSETFDEEGWLKTGDIVYYDDDLMFYVVDRVKEVMKYRSWHVAPSLMERVLLDHPTVKQAVVIGIPDPEDGDHPMAIIVPEEKYINSITVDDIAKFAAEKLPDKMQLRGGVKFLDSLPVTPSGKIKRKEIRDMVLNGVI